MSRQLAVSAAFSIFMMASYVLLGGDATFELSARPEPGQSLTEVAAPALPDARTLLPSLR